MIDEGFEPNVYPFMHESRIPVSNVESPSSQEPSNRGNRGGRESRWKRLRRRWIRPRRLSRHSMLPVLIKVFAGFSKVDGELEEREIDSAMGFLRHDYPEKVYSELRELYSEALRESQDLNQIAKDLAETMSIEDKVLLGVQLYALISRAELQKDHLIAFYLFMTNLGIASEAIDIVYQLNRQDSPAEDLAENSDLNPGASEPLETIVIRQEAPADVVLPQLGEDHAVAGFRFRDLILLKNIGTKPVIMRGRQIRATEFIRLFEGQRVLLGEMVLDYQDIVSYFNAKKNVSSTKLFVSFQGGEPFVEKQRTKQSFLEVEFGLAVSLKVLQDTPAAINQTRLDAGEELECSLRDKIAFDNHTEISMSDLRRRARLMGGRFNLNPTRSDYLISNNPVLLREGDILLSQGTAGELLFHISCDHEAKTGNLEILKSDRTITIDGFPIRFQAALRDGDTITIGDGQFLRCHFNEGIIEEERNVVSRLQVDDLSFRYNKRTPALENMSFSLNRGEMVCVMGPSGCGKSTLLKSIAGLLKPDGGRILLNNVDLYRSNRNRKQLTPYISFIPHEEAVDSLLTVEENLDFAAAIRAPHFRDADRKRKVDGKMVELGLNEFRHRLAGSEDTKRTLSHGQRKRLNVGLDMVGVSDVYLFDEPTSGLSSKDSEHVLEIIRGLSHNKIVMVSIHQPSARLFHLFHKAILLDEGGKLVFFGTPQQMLDYFHQVDSEEAIGSLIPGQEDLGPAPKQPDFIFDVLETPLRDLSGDVIYEEDERGHVIQARRFSPNFWRDRFQAFRLMEEVQLEEPETDPNPVKPPPKLSRTRRDDWVQFSTLLKRAYLSKLRNRFNLATTLLLAPILAVLVSTVLRHTESGVYNFASAFHIPTYLFLTLVIGLFLGLTNSADEVLRDQIFLQRERNHRLKASHYVIAKFLALCFFSLIQCLIYVAIGDAILSIRGMFFVDLFWMFSTTVIGVIFGLLISSIVPNIMTALNLIPLILIPNIILGGALIQYDEMNRDVDVIGKLRRWLAPEAPAPRPRIKSLEVPEICQIMPLRWSYEGVIISHGRHNPISQFQNELHKTIRHYREKFPPPAILTPEQERENENAKNALTIAAGLEAESPAELRNQLRKLRRTVREGEVRAQDFDLKSPEGPSVSSEEIFVNQKVRDLLIAAKAEREDLYAEHPPNVFFGTEREFRFVWPPWQESSRDDTSLVSFGVNTIMLDIVVIGGFGAGGLFLFYLSVLRRMRSV